MINWPDIDTVLLDMDGTLLDLHFDNYFWLQHVPKIYGEKQSLDFAMAQSQVFELSESLRGCMEWYCLDYWSNKLGLDIARMKHDVHHKIALRPWVNEFLAALNTSGKEVILLTNAHRDSLDLKMQITGIAHHFKALVSTHDYGYPKEQAQLWHSFRADYPFDQARTLLIDDTEVVLDSAQSFGIAHLLTLTQPDSQNLQRQNLRYPAFLHFDELMLGSNLHG